MQDLYNISFERSLLAAILFDPNQLNELDYELDEKDFGYKPHGIIFTAMKTLNQLELPINADFITKQTAQIKGFDIGGEIVEILATTPIVDIKSYIQEIKDLSLKRRLRSLAIAINEKSNEINTSSSEIINDVESQIFSLRSTHSNKEFRDLKDITSSVLDNLEELKRRQNTSNILIGVDTGFSVLNRYTAGFKNGELIILAARPAMGKTALALNMAIPTLGSGKGVVFFSLEMDAEQIVTRMLSSITNIPLQNLRIGNLNDKEWQFLHNKTADIASWKFYVDDSGGLDISHLRSKLRKQKLKDPDISLAIVDYLQLMTSISKQDRHLQVAEISRGLKLLARELNIPIIALSQLNRALESRDDRRPQLSDLRESGSIEQDADIILFIYRDDIYKRKDQKARIAKAKKEGKEAPKEAIIQEQEVEEAELIIGKHRNGPIGTIHLNMHTKYTRFTDITDNYTNEPTHTKMIDEIDEVVPL